MGSTDLVFPHNENEIAQSRALTGEPGARFWLHSELVLVGGKKMTYAEQSRVTLPDLLQRGYTAREIRFFLLQAHYRQPVQLTDTALESARASLRRLDACWNNLSKMEAAGPRVAELEGWLVRMKDDFTKALFNDMNIPSALASLFRLVRQVNHLVSAGRLHGVDARTVREALCTVDRALGILPDEEETEALPEEIEQLVQQRDAARAEKDFALADRIREELTERGYEVHDLAGGTRVARRN
jgi:cysteinyl-tRNA synthetase